MAGGFGIESDGVAKDYPRKVTAYVIITCIAAAMGGLIFGDMTYFGFMLTMFTSSLYSAALMASFCVSTVTRSLSRRWSMMLGGIIFLCGARVNAVAEDIVMLIIGRILLGIAVGFATQMVPYKHRGSLNVLFQLSITVGILCANVINYFTQNMANGEGWRMSLSGATAREMLHRIWGVSDCEVEAEFNDIMEVSEASKTLKDPWSNLLAKRKCRPHPIMSVLILIFQQLTGINVVMFASQSCSSPSEVVVASLIGWKFGVTSQVDNLPGWYAILVVICICILWGPLGWMVPSEIFPLEIRSAAQSIVVCINMFFTFLITQIFLTVLCHMKFGLFIFFAFFIVLITTFIYFFVSETKNIPIEEMSQVWEDHWYKKKCVIVDGPSYSRMLGEQVLEFRQVSTLVEPVNLIEIDIYP
ncbi:hypothetical protein EUGRSUZ_F02212 [Eucalyptus grandis]|uniref:Uncharacterized protein n=2 Tax=Eucalyptus grandis TaxID=71139 RepID=A0ACC3KHM3_EUCGR|nr:hypothetical protein EUGRSUZ_F02212 [Eucalyptus grandis]